MKSSVVSGHLKQLHHINVVVEPQPAHLVQSAIIALRRLPEFTTEWGQSRQAE